MMQKILKHLVQSKNKSLKRREIFINTVKQSDIFDLCLLREMIDKEKQILDEKLQK